MNNVQLERMIKTTGIRVGYGGGKSCSTCQNVGEIGCLKRVSEIVSDCWHPVGTILVWGHKEIEEVIG
jgi:hypothetical protein